LYPPPGLLSGEDIGEVAEGMKTAHFNPARSAIAGEESDEKRGGK
jgi:hypothetical protein